MTTQLALDVDRTEPHRGGVDLDVVRHELWRTQDRALEQAWRALHASRPCRCARPWREGAHCCKCGREVAS